MSTKTRLPLATCWTTDSLQKETVQARPAHEILSSRLLLVHVSLARPAGHQPTFRTSKTPSWHRPPAAAALLASRVSSCFTPVSTATRLSRCSPLARFIPPCLWSMVKLGRQVRRLVDLECKMECKVDQHFLAAVDTMNHDDARRLQQPLQSVRHRTNALLNSGQNRAIEALIRGPTLMRACDKTKELICIRSSK